MRHRVALTEAASPLVTQAVQQARQTLRSHAGYTDLVDFKVVAQRKPDATWVGMYRRGSVDRPVGATLHLNTAHLTNVPDAVDTILHELGHALWELLDAQAQHEWDSHPETHGHGWGPEEAFADTFMYLLTGRPTDVDPEVRDLFQTITQTAG